MKKLYGEIILEPWVKILKLENSKKNSEQQNATGNKSWKLGKKFLLSKNFTKKFPESKIRAKNSKAKIYQKKKKKKKKQAMSDKKFYRQDKIPVTEKKITKMFKE